MINIAPPRLTAEQRRVLHKRIVTAIEQARWYPGKSPDAHAVADKVLRDPFTVPELIRDREV